MYEPLWENLFCIIKTNKITGCVPSKWFHLQCTNETENPLIRQCRECGSELTQDIEDGNKDTNNQAGIDSTIGKNKKASKSDIRRVSKEQAKGRGGRGRGRGRGGKK